MLAAPPARIEVTAGRSATPFSKGILSQSLLAASLDPNDAFDVAREIELGLLRRDKRKLKRKSLRRLTYETLGRRFGSETAERYLVWRHYQEPERPVLVLLGGTTGAGKTSLALEVALRLGIRRVLSTDSIRQVMRVMLSPDLMPAIHASSFDAHRFLPPPRGEGNAVIEGFLAQSSVVSVGVRAVLDRALAENASVVLDGVSLVPGLIDLDAYRNRAHPIFIVVGVLDVDAFRSRFTARGHHQRRRRPHRYIEHVDDILEIQSYFLELAERQGVPIIDNQSIDSSVTQIIRHVVDTLRQKGDVDRASLL